MSLHCFHTVDILSSVGLRELNISELNASLHDVACRNQTSFNLSSPLSLATIGMKWRVIEADFPMKFSMHIAFDGSDYSGTLLSIGDGQISIAYSSTLDNSSSSILISLPGIEPFSVLISRQSEECRSLGVSIQNTRLEIVDECVTTTMHLPKTPDELDLSGSGSVVEIFDEPTIVSAMTIIML